MKRTAVVAATLLSSAMLFCVFSSSMTVEASQITPHFDSKISTADIKGDCSRNSLVAMAKPDVTAEELQSSIAVDEALLLISDDTYATYKLNLAPGFTLDDAMSVVAGSDDILHVQPDYALEDQSVGISNALASYNTTTQWHHDAIHTLEAWDLLKTTKRSKTRVAIVDSSFDWFHTEFSGIVNHGLCCDFSSGKREVPDTTNYHTHGTHVAGIIGASSTDGNGVFGIANGYNNDCVELVLISTQKLPTTAQKNETAFISAVIGAVGYASSVGCRVCNISMAARSFAVTRDDRVLIEKAMQTALARGMVVATASGNDGTTALEYPSCLSCVFSVGSLTITNHKLTRSSFSNYGKIEVSAPGSSIRSTDCGNDYRTASGTSMASPMFAGVVSLVLSANQDLSAYAAAKIVCDTATDLGDSKTGSGCINAYKAVAEALYRKDHKKRTVPSSLSESPYLNQESADVSLEVASEAYSLLTNMFQGAGLAASGEFGSTLATKLANRDYNICDTFNKFYYSSSTMKSINSMSNIDFMLRSFRKLFNRDPNVNEYWMSIYYMSSRRTIDLPGLWLKDKNLRSELSKLYPDLEMGNPGSNAYNWN